MNQKQKAIHKELKKKHKLNRKVCFFFFDNVICDGDYNTLVKYSKSGDYESFDPIEVNKSVAFLVLKMIEVPELKVKIEALPNYGDADINEKMRLFGKDVVDIADEYIETQNDG